MHAIWNNEYYRLQDAENTCLFTDKGDVIVYAGGRGGWIQQVAVRSGYSLWRPVGVDGGAEPRSAVMYSGCRPGRETTQRATRVRRIVVRVELLVVVCYAAQSVVVVIVFVGVVVVIVVMSVMLMLVKMMMMMMIVRMLQRLMINVVRCHRRFLRSWSLLQPSENKCNIFCVVLLCAALQQQWRRQGDICHLTPKF